MPRLLLLVASSTSRKIISSLLVLYQCKSQTTWLKEEKLAKFSKNKNPTVMSTGSITSKEQTCMIYKARKSWCGGCLFVASSGKMLDFSFLLRPKLRCNSLKGENIVLRCRQRANFALCDITKGDF